ncbi:ABC transporter substrate-binding protein [Halovivax limisalsi]|uniref:ABC transporter substrate-binding protein n=1 Tax=Halovivax limisalsi TaxID=1453760 RepID=UPI001FFD5E04|nr:ABC transporter substrate-binding protein [Halovivax limisalsi]
MTDNDTNANGTTNRRPFLKTMAAGGATAALAGCLDSLTGGGGDGSTYDVGLVNPYTGDLAPFADRNDRGSDLALNQINDEKVAGGTINKITADSETTSNAGVSAAQKLVNQDGVDVLTGPCSSGVAVSIAESVTIPNEITHIMINSTAPGITNLEDDGYCLRTSPSDAFQGQALAQVVADNGPSSASVIMVNNDYGQGLADAFKARYEELGNTVETMVPAEQGRSSYSAQLNEATNAEPEAVVFIVYPQSFMTMIREAYEMGIQEDYSVFGAESMVSDEVENNVSAEAINGMKGTNPSPPIESEVYQNFAEDFQNEYDRQPTVWAAYAYDAYMLLGLAIHAAGEYGSDAVKEQIYEVSKPDGTEVSSIAEGKSELDAGNSINYQGASGNVDLDENGDPSGTYQHWEVIDGAFEMQGFVDTSQ